MSRARMQEMLDGLLDFAVVVTSTVSTVRNTILSTLRGDVEDDGTSEDAPDCEVWGEAALTWRPADPTSEGSCELLIARRDDQVIGIASKDRRWQVTLEKGEVNVRAFGPSAARVVLKPDGTAIIQGANVKIGAAGATEYMVLGDQLAIYLANLKSYIDFHTHPETGGDTLPPSPISPSIPTIKSSKHQVES